MFQVNATLAILLSFFTTFLDEIGEMGELSPQKIFLISVCIVVVYLIYKESKRRNNIDMTSDIPNTQLATKAARIIPK